MSRLRIRTGRRWRTMRRRLPGRPTVRSRNLHAVIAVLLIVSWALPPFALIGVPVSILLAFLAILCIITVVFIPLVFGIY